MGYILVVQYDSSRLFVECITTAWFAGTDEIHYTTADKNLLPALLAACVAILLLVIKVSGYAFQEKKWIVELHW